MRTRIALSALAALLTAFVTVAGNSTAAQAQSSAPAVQLGDALCC